MPLIPLRPILFALLVLVFPAARVAAGPAPEKHPLRASQREMFNTLKNWCDALLALQLAHGDPALDGGIMCPGCGFIHGRIGDAIYPLLYLADQTGDTRYIEAAKKLFTWSEANVRFADGAWNNEVGIYTWKGVTTFGAIGLMETLRDYGRLLDANTKQLWTESIKGQLPYIMKNIKPGYGNINYPASASYALALAAKLTGDKQYSERAAWLAGEMLKQFTPNEALFFGESSYPYIKSAKGLMPVDPGYNMEETLPNLLAYADMTGDAALREKVIRSARSHLEFMLGDGALDNSWGTRNFKWSYWGSRTCDGILGMCAALAKDDPVFAEAAWRNYTLLSACTHGGLLHGGVDYVSAGYRPCVHHTFEHAKSLAHALHGGFGKPARATTLPREEPCGAKYFKDLDVWTVATGNRRARKQRPRFCVPQ